MSKQIETGHDITKEVEFREEQEKADEKNYGDSMESESDGEDEETILDIVHRNMVERKFPETQRFFFQEISLTTSSQCARHIQSMRRVQQ
jgi:hypothetical protein